MKKNKRTKITRNKRQMRIKSSNIQPNDEKFKELILYIASHSEDDPAFGATKLNKLLFFADFITYLRLGHPITGQEYQRLENGPAPRRMLPAKAELLLDNDIAISKPMYF